MLPYTDRAPIMGTALLAAATAALLYFLMAIVASRRMILKLRKAGLVRTSDT
jgi:hypothetical protein